MRMLVYVLCVLLSSSFSSSQPRRFSADDLPKIVRITDPQISPDGKTVAIVVSRANMKDDRWDAEIQLIEIASGQTRVVTRDRPDVSSPRWSPKGERLAYLAQDANKTTQIFVMPLDGGDPMQVTHSKTPVKLLAWKPDGTGFAFTAADEAPAKKDEAKFDDAFEVGNNSLLERSRALPVHLWMASAAGGEAKRLTSGSWSLPNLLSTALPQMRFTPDGTRIIFVKADSPLTGDGAASRVQVLEIASGAMRDLTGKSDEWGVTLSPDGMRIAYRTLRDRKVRNETAVYVTSINGGEGADAAYALDRSISGAEWMPDSRSLLLAFTDDTRALYAVQPIGGAAKRVELGELMPTTVFTVGHEGGIAFTATTPTHPAELYYLAKSGDVPIQLTHLQTVTEGMTLGRMEKVQWKSDRFDVSGVLTYPPEHVSGRKYPLVLYIHGGPSSASLTTFTPPAQIFAAKGWLVLEPNYRGSFDRGSAFESAIEGDLCAGPGRDIVAGVEAIKRLGIVDDTRIAVSGWSYGGQMTSWLIGNYPTMWRAAVAGAPVTDLVDMHTLSDLTLAAKALVGYSPFEGDKMKMYQAQSPISYAARAKTPTLIMADVGDYRVPITNAYKLYHALKDNNVPVKFIAYPVGGHIPADPIRYRDVYRRWTAWLSTYLDESSSLAKQEAGGIQ